MITNVFGSDIKNNGPDIEEDVKAAAATVFLGKYYLTRLSNRFWQVVGGAETVSTGCIKIPLYAHMSSYIDRFSSVIFYFCYDSPSWGAREGPESNWCHSRHSKVAQFWWQVISSLCGGCISRNSEMENSGTIECGTPRLSRMTALIHTENSIAAYDH